MPVQNRASRPERLFRWTGLALYVLVAALVASRHEPWHDELQAWRIASDSDGLSALLRNLRYEGHPPLYYLLLKLLVTVAPSWHAAVAAHVAVASATAWTVLRYAPFTKLQRLCVIGGYFFLYEYAVIVRSYALGVLFAVLACAFWCAPRRRHTAAASCVVLLAMTSAVGLAFALALALALTLDANLDAGPRFWTRRGFLPRTLGIAVAMLAVTIVVALQILPPSDALYRGEDVVTGAHPLRSIGWILSLPLRVLFPLSASQADGVVPWQLWRFDPGGRVGLLGTDLGSLLVCLTGAAIFMRRRAALVLWVTSVAGMIVFFTAFHGGAMRHHGYIVLALIASAWIAFSGPADPWTARLARATRWLEPRRRAALTLLLLPMLPGSVQMSLADVRQEFSDADAIVTQLRARQLDGGPIVALAYPWAQSVAAVLGRPVFFTSENRAGTFVDASRRHPGEYARAVADSLVPALLATHCQVAILTTALHPPSAWLQAHSQFVFASARQPMAGVPMQLLVVRSPDTARCPLTARLR